MDDDVGADGAGAELGGSVTWVGVGTGGAVSSGGGEEDEVTSGGGTEVTTVTVIVTAGPAVAAVAGAEVTGAAEARGGPAR
ncbi:hypothetical protein AB0F72_16095 [Actinoplanes sp. NPDC023936]|uniref:hypothetical protein n=1 Tax=Actinoplanes sp. NPDC023936 TaxID=3154910 RepID=UPI0034027CD9